MNQKGFATILLVVISILLVGAAGYFVLAKKGSAPGPTPPRPTVGAPLMSKISPSAGPVGTVITISGSRFNSTANIVHFGSSYTNTLNSPDGTTLQFTVPNDLGCPDAISVGSACVYGSSFPVLPGKYGLWVTNVNGQSKTVTFTVTKE